MPPKKTRKPLNNKKKLVVALTGITGFLGGSILQQLEQDDRFERIIGLDWRKPKFSTKKTKFYRLSLTETLERLKRAPPGEPPTGDPEPS